MKKHTILVPALLLLGFVGCQKATTTPVGSVDCTTITYSGTIKPLIDSKCISCHSTTSPDGSLSTYAATKTFVDNGKFKTQVITTRSMPQGTALSSDQLGQFQCWLDAGAPNN